jgi:hypothetical protein
MDKMFRSPAGDCRKQVWVADGYRRSIRFLSMSILLGLPSVDYAVSADRFTLFRFV